MKKNVENVIFSLILFFSLSASSGWTSLYGTVNQNADDIQILQVFEISKDNECKDPQAPRIAEVFITAPVKLNSTTKSYTCGIQFSNALGHVVARLSQTTTVEFSTHTHTIKGAHRTAWGVNSAYSWRDINGPSPRSGTFRNYNNMTNVQTRGTLWYLNSPWHHHVTVRTTIYPYENDFGCRIY